MRLTGDGVLELLICHKLNPVLMVIDPHLRHSIVIRDSPTNCCGLGAALRCDVKLQPKLRRLPNTLISTNLAVLSDMPTEWLTPHSYDNMLAFPVLMELLVRNICLLFQEGSDFEVLVLPPVGWPSSNVRHTGI